MKNKTEKRLHALFKKDVKSLEIKKFITRWFGPKCKEFSKNCECCKRWKNYKDLIENPFNDE